MIDKKERVDGATRNQGALVIMYNADVHMAIVYMCRVDGTLPPAKTTGLGKKALNFFPDEGSGHSMCVSA